MYGGQGYSGHGKGWNNPSMQNISNVGPIPQGTYRIGSSYNSTKVGPFALPLISERNTNTFGRFSFLMHGDNQKRNHSASNSCMIFDRAIRKQVDQSGDKILKVVP
ncbi:tlde1 domain-containing protein [Sulfurimonas sp. HSL-1716]|uniref:tlde1 domain-containing protein n=1 Tax=Hydrocurvibacter sulfurireducens TaxID=3131937 RepID=UPI0031F73B6E